MIVVSWLREEHNRTKLAVNRTGEAQHCNGNIFPLRWDKVAISPVYVLNGVFLTAEAKSAESINLDWILMRRAHVKPCFATVALLAALLSAEHLPAAQIHSDRPNRCFRRALTTAEAVVVLRQIVTDDPRQC